MILGFVVVIIDLIGWLADGFCGKVKKKGEGRGGEGRGIWTREDGH